MSAARDAQTLLPEWANAPSAVWAQISSHNSCSWIFSVQLLQADEERAQQPAALLPGDEDTEQAEPGGQHGCSIPSPGTSAGDGSAMARDSAF